MGMKNVGKQKGNTVLQALNLLELEQCMEHSLLITNDSVLYLCFIKIFLNFPTEWVFIALELFNEAIKRTYRHLSINKIIAPGLY